MDERSFLQIPGPTNVPERIRIAVAQPMINHRSAEFTDLLSTVSQGIRAMMRTSGDVLFFPSSGSGGLESTIVNLHNPGDKILNFDMGVFSARVGKIGAKFGLDVNTVALPWGSAVKPEDVLKVLEADKDHKIRTVYLPHTETTTGVANPIREIGEAIAESGHPALYVVDAVSSFASMPLEMDSYHIDVVVSAAQKGLMLPPGFSIVALNAKAWDRAAEATLPKWYWDYATVLAKMKDGQFPYTPATALLFGLRESLKMINEEGLENVWQRHNQLASLVRGSINAMGLSLFAEPGYRSDTLTTIHLPDGVAWKDLSKSLQADFNVVLGGGLDKLAGKIFRIGHMGYLSKMDVYAIMGAIEMELIKLGYPVEPGTTAAFIARELAKS
ncbi:MAG TPA: alanine--glyoxylate aminotransferase family protein [Bellilinea sp.]|nr:alanine--glyoxylate aminotransferase family protein [Bellilinea sp.]